MEDGTKDWGRDDRASLWEEVQKKTFCGWINMHLSTRQMRVNNLEEDFCDGVKLITLLEILHGKPIEGRYYRNPKSKPYKIDNVNFALNFITDNLKVKLISCSAEDIVDGNIKIILGMCWRLIQNFQLTQENSRQTLLNWCKEITSTYPNLEIENFQSSFTNGLIFCALVHKYDSTLFTYDTLKQANKLENLTMAFSLAEEHMDVPQLLDATDIINGLVDERSLMTYISLIHRAFEQKTKPIKRFNPNLSSKASSNNNSINLLKEGIAVDVEKIQKENDNLLEELEKIRKEYEEEKRLRIELETEQSVLKNIVSQHEEEKEKEKEKEGAAESSSDDDSDDSDDEKKSKSIVPPKESSEEEQNIIEKKEIKEKVPKEETPKEEPKEEIKEKVKEEPAKEEPKEEVKEAVKEVEVKEVEVKEEVKGAPKEDASKEDTKVEEGKVKKVKKESSSKRKKEERASSRKSERKPREVHDDKGIEEIHKQLAERDQRISDLEKEVADTRNKLREQSKVSETLQKSLEDTREEIGLIQKRQKKAQDKDTKKQQKRLDKRIQRREKELETIKTNSRNELQEKNDEIERLKAQLKKAQTQLGSIDEQPKEAPILSDVEFLKSEYQSLLPIIFNFEEEEKTLAIRSAKPKLEVPDEPDDEDK